MHVKQEYLRKSNKFPRIEQFKNEFSYPREVYIISVGIDLVRFDSQLISKTQNPVLCRTNVWASDITVFVQRVLEERKSCIFEPYPFCARSADLLSMECCCLIECLRIIPVLCTFCHQLYPGPLKLKCQILLRSVTLLQTNLQKEVHATLPAYWTEGDDVHTQKATSTSSLRTIL